MLIAPQVKTYQSFIEAGNFKIMPLSFDEKRGGI